MNSEPIPIPTPHGQEKLGERALELIEEINTEVDLDHKDEKQREFDMMTIPLLRSGIVVAEKFKEDPTIWKELLDEFTNADENYDVKTVSHRIYDYNVGL